MKPFKALLGSRKFITALAGVVVTIAAQWGLELSTEQSVGIVTLFVAVIAGIAWEDGAQKRNGP